MNKYLTYNNKIDVITIGTKLQMKDIAIPFK